MAPSLFTPSPLILSLFLSFSLDERHERGHSPLSFSSSLYFFSLDWAEATTPSSPYPVPSLAPPPLFVSLTSTASLLSAKNPSHARALATTTRYHGARCLVRCTVASTPHATLSSCVNTLDATHAASSTPLPPRLQRRMIAPSPVKHGRYACPSPPHIKTPLRPSPPPFSPPSHSCHSLRATAALLELPLELLLHKVDAAVVTVTRRWTPPRRRHCPSPSFPFPPFLLLPLNLPLPSSDPPQNDDALDTPTLPVKQSMPSEEEQPFRDAAKTSTHDATPPPTRLHDAKPPLTAGKPCRHSPFF
jgi:hypothetical protein